MATPGTLSVVATPIGNLDDITLRALATLRNADIVLAEDTRRTRVLLTHHGIRTQLRSLHEHSTPAEVERYVAELAEGKRLALVTDAGTPLVSDPGAALVRLATQAGVTLETIPGPSAVTAALAVCGLPFTTFRFVGFAPRSGKERSEWLAAIANEPAASVFFESPMRLHKTLDELAPLLTDERLIAVCRELTKVHEEVARGTASELVRRFADGARGEITVVVGAGEVRVAQEQGESLSIEEQASALLATGMSARDVARQLAKETGGARREIYARVQAMMKRP